MQRREGVRAQGRGARIQGKVGVELKGVELRHKVGGGRAQGRRSRTQGRGGRT